MSHKIFSLALGPVLFALCFPAQAQQPGKIPWIGYLAGSGSGPEPAFIEGLRDLGYVEGKSIGIVFRTSESRSERYADLAAEVVRLKVDVIVADGSSLALAVKKAINSIPIVVPTSTDPVGTGLVGSMARPGGNVTGLTTLTEELGGKQLELLKEIVAGLNRVAILRPRGSANDIFVKETEPTARTLGVKIIPLVFRGPEDFDKVFAALNKDRPDALFVILAGGRIRPNVKRIADFALKSRLASAFDNTLGVEVGGLMSYGADEVERHRRIAYYVDKILKGAKPADLPVEQPTKFEFVINLKTANQIGLTIPPDLLARATKIIR